jgi:hypothetical protein
MAKQRRTPGRHRTSGDLFACALSDRGTEDVNIAEDERIIQR